jgi:hypothetical protein
LADRDTFSENWLSELIFLKIAILAEFTDRGACLSDGWRGGGGKMPFYDGFAKKG